jgi:hypothetical protein
MACMSSSRRLREVKSVVIVFLFVITMECFDNSVSLHHLHLRAVQVSCQSQPLFADRLAQQKSPTTRSSGVRVIKTIPKFCFYLKPREYNTILISIWLLAATGERRVKCVSHRAHTPVPSTQVAGRLMSFFHLPRIR